MARNMGARFPGAQLRDLQVLRLGKGAAVPGGIRKVHEKARRRQARMISSPKTSS